MKTMLKPTALAIFCAILTACQSTEVNLDSQVAVPTQFSYGQTAQGSTVVEELARTAAYRID